MIVHVQFFVLSSYVTNNALLFNVYDLKERFSQTIFLAAVYNGMLLKGYVCDTSSVYQAIEQQVRKLFIRHGRTSAGIEPATLESWSTLSANLAIWLCFNLFLFISVLFTNK